MSSSGNPTSTPAVYRPAVITFMDILGFKEIIQNKTADEVQKIIQLVRHYSKSDDVDLEDYDGEITTAINFSDSVIRIRYFDTEYSSGALFHEILNLVHTQAELADKGVLVRGGLTVGDVYADSTTVFGPGFVKAYQLESEFANYPRIIVDPEAFNQLRLDYRLVSSGNDADHDVHYIRNNVKQGDDGLWFIDYLSGIISELDDPDYFDTFLEKHKDLIVSQATRSAAYLRVHQKYLWMARYHNEACVKYNYISHVITDADIPALEQLEDNSGIDDRY